MMNKQEYIQAIMESAGRLKQLAVGVRLKVDGLQPSTAQLELLHLLFFHQKISVKQAAAHLSVSLSAVSQLADPLQTSGYLDRQHDQHDRRIIYLSLTPKGRRLIKNLKSNFRGDLRAIMETLDYADLEALHKIYKKMMANATQKELDD